MKFNRFGRLLVKQQQSPEIHLLHKSDVASILSIRFLITHCWKWIHPQAETASSCSEPDVGVDAEYWHGEQSRDDKALWGHYCWGTCF